MAMHYLTTIEREENATMRRNMKHQWIDLDSEFSRNLRRQLRFYFREIELFSASNEAHVDDVLCEIHYLELMGMDRTTRIYMTRKMKELRAKFPRNRC